MSVHRLHARCGTLGAQGPFAAPGTERQYERSSPFQVDHLALALTLDFEQASVEGIAALSVRRRAREATELELDAIAFQIDEVTLETEKGRRACPFEYDGEKLKLDLQGIDAGKVHIRYRAWPKRGLYFLKPDEHVERPVEVWSQCQDQDARHWFPCVDRPNVKMTSELEANVPSGMVVLSNGRLTKKETEARAKRWVYRFELDKPHPSYLVTLVVGRFSIVQDESKAPKVPVEYYLPPGKEADGKRGLGRTPQMLDLFSKLTGVPYPWGSYAQVVVHDFVFGGMENTTATTLYEHVLLDERAAIDIESDDLVAHELAHQWFGNYVTCRDWSEAWLNEGFATFFENIEREHRLGRDEYDYRILGDLEAYLGEADGRYQRPIVCRDYGEPIDLFDRHLYEKGGLVLHLLRRELGDDDFWRGVRTYLERHAHGNVETRDLERAFEDVSGRSLSRFFDEWVYRPGHPVLKVSMSWEKGALSVRVRQTQKTPNTATFALLVEVEVETEAGPTRHRKCIDVADDVLVVPLERRPHWAGFDPDQRILGNIEVTAPFDMLRAQLRDGTSASLRLRAARALGKSSDQLSLSALGHALQNENESWMVRVEAAKALGEVRGQDSLRELRKALATPEPRVRRAVVRALGSFKSEEAAKLLLPLAEGDPSYLVESEAVRALGSTRHAPDLTTLTAALGKGSWADVIKAGAVEGLAETWDDKALPFIEKATRYGVPTRARRAAIRALPKASHARKVRYLLEDLLDDPHPHVRVDVALALQDFGDPRARSALNRRLQIEKDGRVVRRLHDALGGLAKSAQGRRLASEDVQGLKDEITGLKARLTKLEAHSDKGKKTGDKRTAKAPKQRPTSPGSKKPPRKAKASARVRKAPRARSASKRK